MRSNRWRIGLAGLVMAASLCMSPASALAVGSTFTVDQSAVNAATTALCLATASCVYDANVFNFRYQSEVAQTIAGGNGYQGDDDPFTESGWAQVTGMLQDTELRPFLGNLTYGLYATFDITGESDESADFATSGEIHSTFATMALRLLLDNDDNNVYNADGTVSSVGGDTLIGTATLVAGEAFIRLGIAQGDLAAEMLFTRTPAGATYFTAPNPFYIDLRFDGNLSVLTDVPAGSGSCVDTSDGVHVCREAGSGNAFFVAAAVPEPASLTLLGIGLLGVCAVARRKSRHQAAAKQA